MANNFLDQFRAKILTLLPALGDRLEPNINQSPTFPRGTYFLVQSSPADRSMLGSHGERDYDLQLDIYSNSQKQAFDMIETARTSLENLVLDTWGTFTIVDVFDCNVITVAEIPSNGSNQTIHHATLLLTISVRG